MSPLDLLLLMVREVFLSDGLELLDFLSRLVGRLNFFARFFFSSALIAARSPSKVVI